MTNRLPKLLVCFLLITQSCASNRERTSQTRTEEETAKSRSLTAEEQRWVQKVGEDLAHGLTFLAANPQAELPPASIAGQLREAFFRFDANAREKKSRIAQKALAENADARRTRFGASAAKSIRELQSTNPLGLDPTTQAQLRSLVQKRLDQFAQDAGKIAQWASFAQLPKTWVKGGPFGESSTGFRNAMSIVQPEVLGFQWNTEEPGAVSGHWELRQIGGALTPERVLATGSVPDDPSKSGIQGFFSIDLAKYLPSTPPLGTGTYHVRVMAMPKKTITAQIEPVSSGGGLVAESVFSETPNGIGPWSSPFVLSYGQSQTPPQNFTEVYRHAEFHLNSIYLVEDQKGPGAEEFYIAGFIQPYSPNGVGTQKKFGPYYAKLHPDGPRRHEFDHRASFQMPSGSSDWPRMFTVVVAVLEVDDGGSLSEWVQSIWKIAENAVSKEVDAAIKERLSELREKMLVETTEKAMETAIDVFRASTTSDFVSAWVQTVATIIIASIEGSLPDDYYGIESATYVLLTNQSNPIEDGQAFFVKHRGGTESLTGRRDSGVFRVKSNTIRLYGQPSYPEAGSFDGKIDLGMYWVFSNRGL